MGITQSVEGQDGTESQKKGKFTLSTGAETPILACSWTSHRHSRFSGFHTQFKTYTISRLPGLRTRTELHHRLSWFSSLQTADHRTSQLHNYMSHSFNKSHVCIYTYPIGLFLWRSLICQSQENVNGFERGVRET